MHEILSVQLVTKKPKQSSLELESITFTKENLERIQHSHNNPLVIQLQIHNYNIKRILAYSDSLWRWCIMIYSNNSN